MYPLDTVKVRNISLRFRIIYLDAYASILRFRECTEHTGSVGYSSEGVWPDGTDSWMECHRKWLYSGPYRLVHGIRRHEGETGLTRNRCACLPPRGDLRSGSNCCP